jgi:hypothetical protein
MKVMKALVIGLGSSGIKVCDYVIERIRWELGDESHAPWVLFLGIETGSTQEATKTKLRELGDLLLITIDPDEYSRLLLFPELLGLNQWADMETLKKLPATAVRDCLAFPTRYPTHQPPNTCPLYPTRLHLT